MSRLTHMSAVSRQMRFTTLHGVRSRSRSESVADAMTMRASHTRFAPGAAPPSTAASRASDAPVGRARRPSMDVRAPSTPPGSSRHRPAPAIERAAVRIGRVPSSPAPQRGRSLVPVPRRRRGRCRGAVPSHAHIVVGRACGDGTEPAAPSRRRCEAEDALPVTGRPPVAVQDRGRSESPGGSMLLPRPPVGTTGAIAGGPSALKALRSSPADHQRLARW